MRSNRWLGLFLLGFWLSAAASAQAAPSPPPPAGTPARVTVGQSIISLNGPWKFTVGDSPAAATGASPEWAQPGFDDSRWETVDLTPAPGSFDPTIGVPGYVAGWTERGHPGYSGFAWYRLRVQVNAQPGQKLALEGPSDVDDAYQVFANGIPLGSFGEFPAGRRPVLYNTQPRMFTLPAVTSSGPATCVLAFRVWMDPATAALAPDAGGMHNAPRLGEASAVAVQYKLAWLEISRGYATSPVLAALYLVMAIIAFSLRLFDRSDPVYFWLGGVCLIIAIISANLAIVAWTQWESVRSSDIVMIDALRPLLLCVWVMVWWVWFRLSRPSWLPKLLLVLAPLYVACRAVANQDLLFGVLSPRSVGAVQIASVVIRMVVLLLLIFVVFRGVREQGREGWLALPAVVLVGLAQFQEELSVLHVRVTWFPFGLQLSLGTVSNGVLIAVMFVLLIRRLFLSVQRQRALAADVQQARAVQHVLLPEIVSVPGLTIDCEYRPAQEVGGDFFQIIPHPTDGSVLIVAGDVTGKGLQAGMLVALLVGAIRSSTEVNADPAFVLGALNRRLLGRGDAQATCLVLRLEASGAATLANAGHLAPYVDGVELAMEGSLPLGMMYGVDFPVMHFQLNPGQRLTLISDGIPEAQDKDGRLFGFARVQDLMRTHRSAAEVASIAQHFGQTDDISIVSVTRATA